MLYAAEGSAQADVLLGMQTAKEVAELTMEYLNSLPVPVRAVIICELDPTDRPTNDPLTDFAHLLGCHQNRILGKGEFDGRYLDVTCNFREASALFIPWLRDFAEATVDKLLTLGLLPRP